MQTPRDIHPPNPQTTGKIKSTNRSQVVPAPSQPLPCQLPSQTTCLLPNCTWTLPALGSAMRPKQAQSPMSNNNSSFPWDPLHA